MQRREEEGKRSSEIKEGRQERSRNEERERERKDGKHRGMG